MARSFDISRQLVWQACKQVKANKNSAGIDGQTIEDFEQNLKGNLYKLWNRMSSGSYFPAISPSSAKAIRREIRSWKIQNIGISPSISVSGRFSFSKERVRTSCCRSIRR